MLASVLNDRRVSQGLFADPLGPLPSDNHGWLRGPETRRRGRVVLAPSLDITDLGLGIKSRRTVPCHGHSFRLQKSWVTNPAREVSLTPAVLNFWVGGGDLG